MSRRARSCRAIEKGEKGSVGNRLRHGAGVILGAHVGGSFASELIAEAVAAVEVRGSSRAGSEPGQLRAAGGAGPSRTRFFTSMRAKSMNARAATGSCLPTG